MGSTIRKATNMKSVPGCGLVPFIVLAFVVGAEARTICVEQPPLPLPLGAPVGCDLCLHYLLPGTWEPSADTRYYILSDLPERFLDTGVLYATVPVLPADRSGNPVLAMRTQVVTGDFTTINDDFDVLFWHTSSPGGGSQPRRIVVYVRNVGTGPVIVTPRQVVVSDGTYTGMSATLGAAVLAGNWNTVVNPITLAPGSGDVVAYGKRIAASSNGSDTSTNAECFGRVRVAVQNSDPNAHPTDLRVYVVAIDGAPVSQNKVRAEALLTTGATSGDPFDLNVPPSGCANRRATGVFPTFVWRSEPTTLDAAALPGDGLRFRMALADLNSQSCPAGQQTVDMLLRPGYVRPDTVGNYMVEYRVALRLINTHPAVPRPVDVRFTQSGASIGLGWQVVVGDEVAPDAVVDARPVRTGWAGPGQSVLERSFLESDGGPVTIDPCTERFVTLRFLILGGSSLPFDIVVAPAFVSEVVVDNRDAGFSSIGTWPVSANPGYWGTDSQYHAGDGGASSATWTPNLPVAGWYSVYAWWVVASNRALAAPYTVTHLAGTSTVYVNQRDTATQQRWNPLGVYRLGAGGSATVTLRAAVPSSELVSADAVRWAYLGPGATSLPGDIDGDGDVDGIDYELFVACLNQDAGCDAERRNRADLDDDGDVDMADFADFQWFFGRL